MSDKDTLLSMGFPADRVAKAVKVNKGSLGELSVLLPPSLPSSFRVLIERSGFLTGSTTLRNTPTNQSRGGLRRVPRRRRVGRGMLIARTRARRVFREREMSRRRCVFLFLALGGDETRAGS